MTDTFSRGSRALSVFQLERELHDVVVSHYGVVMGAKKERIVPHKLSTRVSHKKVAEAWPGSLFQNRYSIPPGLHIGYVGMYSGRTPLGRTRDVRRQGCLSPSDPNRTNGKECLSRRSPESGLVLAPLVPLVPRHPVSHFYTGSIFGTCRRRFGYPSARVTTTMAFNNWI